MNTVPRLPEPAIARRRALALLSLVGLAAAIGVGRLAAPLDAGEPPAPAGPVAPPGPVRPTSPAPAAPRVPATRPFRLGFTRWPADLTLEGVRTAETFALAHGDVVSVMMIGGIPWEESLTGAPYSRDVEAAFAWKPPAGTKVFLSISPLDMLRRGLAPNWGERDNQPLPRAWAARTFDAPEVRRAYLAFTLRAVEAMRPDWLAIGVELNDLLSNDPAAWPALKRLHRETYAAVKARHPALPVCFTTDVLHYKRLAAEAKGSDQEGEVADLMEASDLFAMSVYPYMSPALAQPFPDGFFDFARGFRKPVAVSESGYTSRDVVLASFGVTLAGTEDLQRRWLSALFATATRDRYEFVVQFATTDFERLCDRLSPPTDDLARVWSFTGLQTSDGKRKPAAATWDAVFATPYAR